MTSEITFVLSRSGNGVLSADEVATIIRRSEGEGSDANKAKGHSLQHVQETHVARKKDYSEKRGWNEASGSGSHSCFKTERQQAELVCDVLLSSAGKSALRTLNSGAASVKVKCAIGSGENMVSQGYLGDLFGVFCNDVRATGVIVELHARTVGAVRLLHIRSAYPVA